MPFASQAPVKQCPAIAKAGVFIVFMLIAHAALAQQKPGSITDLLKKYKRQDTIRVNLLNAASAYFAPDDFNKAGNYADTAIALAKQLNNQSKLAESYFNKGRSLNLKNEFKQAVAYYSLALQLYIPLGKQPQIALCYLELARNTAALANYVVAINYGKKALALSGKDLLFRAKCLNVIGSTNTYMADYTTAAAYHFQQLKIYEQLKNKDGLARTYGNLGVIYYELKKYHQSIKYGLHSLKLFRQLGDKLWAAAALNNIGGCYLEMNNYRQAINYNMQALALNKIVNSRKGAANDLMDIGVAYSGLKQYPQAIDYLGRAIVTYDTLGAKNNSSIALGHLAAIYLEAPAAVLKKQGISPAKRYAAALKVQQEAIALAKQTHDRNNEANQLKTLSRVYELQGNTAAALKTYRQYINLRDSVVNDSKNQEITRLTMQYAFDKKEAAIKIANSRKEVLARLEISRQKYIRNTLLLIAFIIAVAAGLSFIFYKRRKDADEKRKEAELRARIADTEMKALRLQLNPHFIFNSLNSIGYYIDRHDKDMADTYLTKFARLMRLVLENSEYEEVSLADDMNILTLYMQLEALRLDHKFKFSIVWGGDIDPDNVLMPPMILQPFIENSIWHGISPKRGEGHISIAIKKEGDLLICTVEDDGVGRKKERQQGSTGEKRSFGIKVIQARIDMINEVKHCNAGVQIVDLEVGTRVIVVLPYQIKF